MISMQILNSYGTHWVLRKSTRRWFFCIPATVDHMAQWGNTSWLRYQQQAMLIPPRVIHEQTRIIQQQTTQWGNASWYNQQEAMLSQRPVIQEPTMIPHQQATQWGNTSLSNQQQAMSTPRRVIPEQQLATMTSSTASRVPATWTAHRVPEAASQPIYNYNYNSCNFNYMDNAEKMTAHNK